MLYKKLYFRLNLRSILLLLVITTQAAFLLSSCEKQKQKIHVENQADSLVNAAYLQHDYERLLVLAEQLDSCGALSQMELCYWRGYAYSRLRKMRQAEMEWKKAATYTIQTQEDLEYYAKIANRQAGLLYLKCNYESSIKTATTALKILKERQFTANSDYANLLTFMGCCQLKLERLNEAAGNFEQAWQHYVADTQNSNDISNYITTIIGIITITDAYIQTEYYQKAYNWAEHFDDMLALYRKHPKANDVFVDKQWARLNLYKATALNGLNRKAEAEQAYQTAQNTEYAKTGDGKIESATYLMKAERWQEAADKFTILSNQLQRFDIKTTIDNIQIYLQPKFLANAAAQRTDSAIAAGIALCTALDSAITWERQNSALELATIYNTQEKETEIVQQKMKLSQQRFLTTLITLVLIILGFGLFIYFRHQAAKRLEVAYHELEKANMRAEESSRMKSDFIHQISHEIRTPLNILSGFTQVITSPDIEIDEESLDDINRQITENTNRITGLVNKMLELSDAKNNMEIDRNDNVSVRQLAVEAVDASAINNARHLTFDMHIATEASDVYLQTNLHSAVRALSLVLDNARKFTAPAEAIHQNLPDTGKQHVTLNVSKDSEQVSFVVEDTGIGVPKEEAERIFEEFVQLDEYYNGTGIGLTVARSIAQRLGGNIVLDTTYTEGARFILTLPCTTV